MGTENKDVKTEDNNIDNQTNDKVINISQDKDKDYYQKKINDKSTDVDALKAYAVKQSLKYRENKDKYKTAKKEKIALQSEVEKKDRDNSELNEFVRDLFNQLNKVKNSSDEIVKKFASTKEDYEKYKNIADTVFKILNIVDADDLGKLAGSTSKLCAPLYKCFTNKIKSKLVDELNKDKNKIPKRDAINDLDGDIKALTKESKSDDLIKKFDKITAKQKNTEVLKLK